ncbi:MAG: M28 family peptidase, partial [Treponema sp.]|nr:M28 family peptidase [Treponema sp.]
MDMSGDHWARFRDFIAPGADRFGLIEVLLEKARLPCGTVTIGGNRHILVAPPPPEESFLRRRPTILVAHYDRAEGSPGANDNSAAVFLLIETALVLREEGIKNWIIIFTDKEELKP